MSQLEISSLMQVGQSRVAGVQTVRSEDLCVVEPGTFTPRAPYTKEAIDRAFGILDGTYLDRLREDFPVTPDAVRDHRRTIMGGSILAVTIAATTVLPSQTAEAQSSPGGGADVVLIGDSLTVGRQAAGLERALRDQPNVASLVVSAENGRPLINVSCEQGLELPDCERYSDGIREIDLHAQAVTDAEVVGVYLGTNDPVGKYGNHLGEVIDHVVEVGSRDGTPPTIIVPKIFGEAQVVQAAAKNRVLEQVVADARARHGVTILTPNLDEVYNQLPGRLKEDDGVHLAYPAGYRPLVAEDVRIIGNIAPQAETVVVPPAQREDADDLTRMFSSSLSSIPNVVQPVGPSTTTTTTSPPSQIRIIQPASPVVEVPAQTADELFSRSLTSTPRSNDQQSQVDTGLTTTAQEIIEIIESPSAPVVTSPSQASDATLQQPTAPESALAEAPGQAAGEADDVAQMGILEIVNKADELGIFYDPTTGEAVQFIGNFADPDEVEALYVGGGWNEDRESYATGNFDVLSRPTFDSPPQPVSHLAGLTGRFITVYTKGEGNKAGVIGGINKETGKTNIFYGTHLSKLFASNGDFVIKGQVIGKTGDTGVASGVHFSIGLESTLGPDRFNEYANAAESDNPFPHFDPNEVTFICLDRATDRPGETCGHDGPAIPLPVDLETLRHFGLPERVDPALLAGLDDVETPAASIVTLDPSIFSTSLSHAPADPLSELVSIVTADPEVPATSTAAVNVDVDTQGELAPPSVDSEPVEMPPPTDVLLEEPIVLPDASVGNEVNATDMNATDESVIDHSVDIGPLEDLLDFISKGEGGYNSMNQGSDGNRIVGLTHDASTILGKDLTEMTLGEIKELQSSGELYAAGRYQIIPETMPLAMEYAGVSDSDVFTPGVQDRMGLGLIYEKRPYLRRYLYGEHDDLDGAILSAAKEWASIPVTTEGHEKYGESFYGLGNKAQHTVEETRAIFLQARAQMDAERAQQFTNET